MNYAVALGLMGIGMIIGIVCSISQIRSDIKRININVNRIAKQVGVPDTVTDELNSLLLEGKRIKAIKKYREVTGVGLIEAKEYVDLLSETELK
ncbi:ribosomal protein L7/L12 [Clostridium estertheticum]|uniref:Ribosomal protein L7/L12 n=1 Tax=Clostridium estertheticum TaxID=238834 RepID=A0AA47EM07_9CLOT|nr:ribosomal protein L7/L12 [Clostridium estertheticum]MBU3157206.1 ribosomal protein L7/L12 [Clostridium estertheticum]WAG62713.1 ribosomal protein L7/L12 [Clostridium estertheticum]